MFRIAPRWWRSAIAAGATTAFILATSAGCGQATPASSRCAVLPASDVPPMQKALTEHDTGSYCATAGTTILIVLKAKDFTAASAWAPPSITGPTGGTRWLTAPLTALRGTTVAAVALTAAGTYRVSSTAGTSSWQATVRVG